MVRIARVALLSLGLQVFSWDASAHVHLTSPEARYEDGNGQKVGVCGSGTRTNHVTRVKAGEVLKITWDETVNHAGHFRIAFDPTGKDAFTRPSGFDDKTVSGNIVAFVDDEGGSSFSYDWTVPDIECSRCTLQLIQVMTGDTYDPDDFGSLYFGCADLEITRAAGGTTTGTTSGTTTRGETTGGDGATTGDGTDESTGGAPSTAGGGTGSGTGTSGKGTTTGGGSATTRGTGPASTGGRGSTSAGAGGTGGATDGAATTGMTAPQPEEDSGCACGAGTPSGLAGVWMVFGIAGARRRARPKG